MTISGSEAPPVLAAELLGGLERRWRDQGWPGVDWLQPGLDDGEIDATTRPLGLRLPLEARRWWGWHNGLSLPEDARRDQLIFGGPGFVYLSLSGAIDRYTMIREIDAGPVWHPTWFPITVAVYGAVIACDCSDPDAERTPIRPVHWASGVMGDVKARSWGEMVTWWLDAMDHGAWRYEPSEGRWERDHEALDPELELTRLV
jgi:cell wall assembly regulator SMI1